MHNPTYITYRGVPLVVDYTVNEYGDILISEVWIKGIEMMALMGDDVLTQLRYEIKRREGR